MNKKLKKLINYLRSKLKICKKIMRIYAKKLKKSM